MTSADLDTLVAEKLGALRHAGACGRARLRILGADRPNRIHPRAGGEEARLARNALVGAVVCAQTPAARRELVRWCIDVKAPRPDR